MVGEMTMHVMADRERTSNPSLQSVRFFLQARFRCKVAPASRHALALRAHRHRLSAFARKKMSALARRQMSRLAHRGCHAGSDLTVPRIAGGTPCGSG